MPENKDILVVNGVNVSAPFDFDLTSETIRKDSQFETQINVTKVSDEDSNKHKPVRTSLNNDFATSPSNGTIVSKESKSSS